MGHHHKAASCSAIPSFQSFSSVSSNATHVATLDLLDQDFNKTQQSNVNRSIRPSLTKTFSQLSVSSELQQQQSFPLPSFCLYSSRALADEYGPESDIIQFLAPVSTILEERLPMFVGVLQSLFSVINDMPFHDQDSDQETDDDDDDNTDDEEEESNRQLSNKNAPFTIIGLNTMKLVIWNNMYHHIVDKDIYENDLSLVVMVSAQMTDDTLLENMNLLRNSITTFSSSIHATANQMGEQLIPLIEYWFDTQ